MLAGQSRVLVKQPEDPAWGIGPEIMVYSVLELTVYSLVLEVSDDTRAGKAADLAGCYESADVIPQGILIDTGHIGKRLHINTRRCGDCLVYDVSCIMLQHILLRNSAESSDQQHVEREELQRERGRCGVGNDGIHHPGQESDPFGLLP